MLTGGFFPFSGSQLYTGEVSCTQDLLEQCRLVHAYSGLMLTIPLQAYSADS